MIIPKHTEALQFASTLKESFIVFSEIIKSNTSSTQANSWELPPQSEYREETFQQINKKHPLDIYEKIILLTALAPILHPELLNILCEAPQKMFSGAIGGYFKEPSRAVMPTCRTALFLMENDDGKKPYSYFSQDHFLFKENILSLGSISANIPQIDAPLILSEEYYHLFTSGSFSPRMSSSFPASRIDTDMHWKDLVIGEGTNKHIQDMISWLEYEEAILQTEGMKKWLKPGYRALFYGPSGTGKSLTAALIGKTFGRPVYRTDLSLMVSKYIGETEKNMENLFNTAESKNWILFFDEAESLFGKRSAVSDSNDRYANQEISYLLQRVEGYNGMVILASNKLFDIDDAFKRRFQSIIEFPEPGPEERLRLWKNMFGSIGFYLPEEIILEDIAAHHRITGGILINVLRFCAMRASARKSKIFTWADIEEGMKKEYIKFGWTWQEKPLRKTEQKLKINVQPM